MRKILLAAAIVAVLSVVVILLVPSVRDGVASPTRPEAAARTDWQPAELPVQGMVTMVDLGAKTCVPCRMMAPILEELKAEYAGRAVIGFIDVHEHKDQVRRFGISAIPTQVFFDAQGTEIQRHVGFMEKDAIVQILARMGVE